MRNQPLTAYAVLCLFLSASLPAATAQEKNGFFEKGYASGPMQADAIQQQKQNKPVAGSSSTPAQSPTKAPDDAESGFNDPFASQKNDELKADVLFSDLPGAANAEKDPSKKIISIGAAFSGENAETLKRNIKTLTDLLQYHKLSSGPLYIVGDPEQLAESVLSSLPEVEGPAFSPDNQSEEAVQALAAEVMSSPMFQFTNQIVENLRFLSSPPSDLGGIKIKYSPAWIIETTNERILLEGIASPARSISAKGYFIPPENMLPGGK